MVQVNLTQAEYQKYLALIADQAGAATASVSTSAWWGLSLTTVLYYLCWLVISIGLILFFAIGTMRYGDGFMTMASAFYALLFHQIGSYAWYSLGSETLGGIILSLAILMVIPAVAGFNSVGDQPSLPTKVSMQIELGMIIVSAYMIYNFPGFSFFVTFIGFATWGFSIDSYRLLSSEESRKDLVYVKRVTEAFGFLMLSLAWRLEHQDPPLAVDYSFWLYFWGITSFWTAITTEEGNSNLRKFCYGCLNLGLIYLWTETGRGPFLFYGLIGVHLYQGYCLFSDWGNSDRQVEQNFAEYIFARLSYRMIYNCLVVGMAYYLDLIEIKSSVLDIPFWLYLHGVILIWWNLNYEIMNTSLNATDIELRWFLSFLWNLGFIAASFYFVRIIFLILGLTGVIAYIFHVSYKFFDNSLMFGAFLIGLGLATMNGIHYLQSYFAM